MLVDSYPHYGGLHVSGSWNYNVKVSKHKKYIFFMFVDYT